MILHEHGVPEARETHRWFEGRKLLRHHHVPRDSDAHYERVARFLAHRAVGLVLAGGGAKAFAHLGVYRALEEERILIDMVGGSSMGSLLAAGIAKGWSARTLIENATRAFTRRDPIGDYSFPPLISMMRGRRMRNLIRKYFGLDDIEDLPLQFFCISGNFTAAQMCVHTRGPLWRALTASVSLPGILPPVVNDGQLHVDGGTFDNFPVRPMRERGAGRIIACDVEHTPRTQLGYQEMPSGLRFFWERYVRRNRRLKVPHAMTTMFRSSFLASYERRREAATLADLVFQSPSRRIGLTHWKSLDLACATGYEYAKRRLEEVGEEGLVELGVRNLDRDESDPVAFPAGDG
jgi:predicted acylesterase/phospholipase RssA